MPTTPKQSTADRPKRIGGSPEGVEPELLDEDEERAPVGNEHGDSPRDGGTAHPPVRDKQEVPADVSGCGQKGDGEVGHCSSRHGQHDAAASAARVGQHGHARIVSEVAPATNSLPEQTHEDGREDGDEETCRPGQGDQPRCAGLVHIACLAQESAGKQAGDLRGDGEPERNHREGGQDHVATGHGINAGLARGGQSADQDDVEPQDDEAER